MLLWQECPGLVLQCPLFAENIWCFVRTECSINVAVSTELFKCLASACKDNVVLLCPSMAVTMYESMQNAVKLLQAGQV